mgnify:CR=1 FL=1
MYKYHCLNPISAVGLDQLDENYVNVETAKGADAILVRSAKMHEMEFDKNLKVIARAGAGVNNIPLERCAEEGVVVFNTPGANANGVKELVIAGMLLAARDIIGGINWVQEYEEDGDIAKITEKKKKVFALLLPITLTAIVCGVTEPIEFTFLFVAPMLFVVHAFLAATLATTMWLAGIVGINSGGLIEIASLNLIPLMRNHWQQYLLELVIGLIFTAIWFVVFRFLILKFDFKTPGREDEAEIEFGSKEKFRNKQAEKGGNAGDPKLELCELILEGLGGKDNIVDVTNCATRLRVNVKDETLCKDDPYFKAIGTHGCSINGKAYQVIIGLKVPSIREVFETLL